MEAFVRYDPSRPSRLYKAPLPDAAAGKAALKGGCGAAAAEGVDDA